MDQNTKIEVARYKLNPGNGTVVATASQGGLRFHLEMVDFGRNNEPENMPLSHEEARLLIHMTKPGGIIPSRLKGEFDANANSTPPDGGPRTSRDDGSDPNGGAVAPK